MGKRLTLSDYIFTLFFVLMLIAVFVAFFYGVHLGKERTEEKYAYLLAEEAPKAEPAYVAYDQQYLVSFYHTIYLPYREFQNKWFEHTDSIRTRSTAADPDDLLKELRVLASQKSTEIGTNVMPSTSPLLQDAHENYLKSLKLFADGLSSSELAGLEGQALLDALNNDAYIQEAKNFALIGQQKYFASIVKWNETFDPVLDAEQIFKISNLSAEEWQSYNLNVKNFVVSTLLTKGKYYGPFYPQDVAARVDELISSGEAERLNLDQTKQFVDTLVTAGAVRKDDFLRSKEHLYQNEPLPQLPFFSSSE